jgi:hypothetical protein
MTASASQENTEHLSALHHNIQVLEIGSGAAAVVQRHGSFYPTTCAHRHGTNIMQRCCQAKGQNAYYFAHAKRDTGEAPAPPPVHQVLEFVPVTAPAERVVPITSGYQFLDDGAKVKARRKQGPDTLSSSRAPLQTTDWPLSWLNRLRRSTSH